MNTQRIFNVGATVFYEGDDTNRGGYGKITDQVTDYTDELQLEITLEDGRVISNVTPAEFEARTVLGNTEVIEFHVVDTWEVSAHKFRVNLPSVGALPVAPSTDPIRR